MTVNIKKLLFASSRPEFVICFPSSTRTSSKANQKVGRLRLWSETQNQVFLRSKRLFFFLSSFLLMPPSSLVEAYQVLVFPQRVGSREISSSQNRDPDHIQQYPSGPTKGCCKNSDLLRWFGGFCY